jgi:hypothetical protein
LKLDREQNIAGAEYLNSCSVFEADMEAQFKKGIPKAQNVYARLLPNLEESNLDWVRQFN